MQVKDATYFEMKLYIGSRRGYKGLPFTAQDLKLVIGKFQTTWKDHNGWTCALRLTPTEFVCMDYQETGWEIGAINYPRFPQKLSDILDFMRQLTRFLLLKFEQERMTLIVQSESFNKIEMLENE